MWQGENCQQEAETTYVWVCKSRVCISRLSSSICLTAATASLYAAVIWRFSACNWSSRTLCTHAHSSSSSNETVIQRGMTILGKLFTALCQSTSSIIRPHHILCVSAVYITDAAWTVCLSLLDTTRSHTEVAKLIKVLFWLLSRRGPRNHVWWGPESLRRSSNFEGLSNSLKSILILFHVNLIIAHTHYHTSLAFTWWCYKMPPKVWTLLSVF